MKIKSIEVFQLPPRWQFLKIETDEGISGWGEAAAAGKGAAICGAVKEFEDRLKGKDPFNIEDHWQSMYRGGFYRGGTESMTAMAGIDQALWDIKGKALNTPTYNLIGGKCRDRIKVYRWVGGDRPHNIREDAIRAYEQGYTAVKMKATEEMHYIDTYDKVDAVLSRVQEIRDALGMKMDVALDFHGRVHKTMAKVLVKELEPFRLMFIEEPVLSENNEALREVARLSSIPLATGERMFSRWEFKKLLTDGYIDIIQPDPSNAGGITECRKIATMAEAYDVAVAFHCPLGPLSLSACMQLNACTPNAVIQEHQIEIQRNQAGLTQEEINNPLCDYLQDQTAFKYDKGHLEITDRPGNGVIVNEERVREISAQRPEPWKSPLWRTEDGVIAEW